MFKEEAAYNAALALTGKSLGNRYLDIKAAQGSSKPDFKAVQGKFRLCFSNIVQNNQKAKLNQCHLIARLCS